MYSVSWLTYHLNVFYAYVQYYTTYLTGMFRDYPLEIKIAAITTTLAFLSIIVIAFILIRRHEPDDRIEHDRDQQDKANDSKNTDDHIMLLPGFPSDPFSDQFQHGLSVHHFLPSNHYSFSSLAKPAYMIFWPASSN